MNKLQISSEANEQITVIEWCDLLNIPCVHIANEGKRGIAYAVMLKRMGMRKGFPDLFVPRARGKYHGLFIEMKYGDNTTTADQKIWLDILSREGYACAVCYTADEAIKVIESYHKLR
jgi:hypothetical protein